MQCEKVEGFQKAEQHDDCGDDAADEAGRKKSQNKIFEQSKPIMTLLLCCYAWCIIGHACQCLCAVHISHDSLDGTWTAIALMDEQSVMLCLWSK
eukprot:2115940-Amphidinium_carterae.1